MMKKKKETKDMKAQTPEKEVEKTAEEKLAEMQEQILELNDKYLRTMAEFENYRRRSIAEKNDWVKMATQDFALKICDVADNFERALEHAENPENSFVKGMLQIDQQLRAVLEREGVKKIEALGEPFDPAFHDALAHIPSDHDESTVAAVIQNGYTMHDKVIRAARVAVSSGPCEAPTNEPPEQEEPNNDNNGRPNGPINIEIK